MFCMVDHKVHAARRRLLAPGFSKPALREWEDTISQKVDMTMAGIQSDLKRFGKADVFAWFTYMATDVISTISFGESLGSLEHGQKSQFILDLERVMRLCGVMSELPILAPIINLFHPPARLLEAGTSGVSLYTRAAHMGPARRETVFSSIMRAGDSNTVTPEILQREATGLIVAGSDTTAVTMTYLVYGVLSSEPGIKEDLIKELESLPLVFTLPTSSNYRICEG